MRIYEGRKGTFNDLGQTWSTPVIAKVPYGSQTTNPPGYKWVAIFGAGYNDEMDLANPDPNNISEGGGRGMYMADVLTGDYFWGRSGVGSQDPVEASMDYPVPSDVAAIDLDGDGRVDRLYVGDTNGYMWRYNIGDLNKDGTTDPAIYSPSCEWTVKKIFSANAGGSEKRRIMLPTGRHLRERQHRGIRDAVLRDRRSRRSKSNKGSRQNLCIQRQEYLDHER